MVTKKTQKPKEVFDINILIGGAAGQGIQTIGAMLCEMLFRAGLYVFALQDYQSRIRGGHNTFRVRVSNEPLTASTARIDILLAMNKETYRLYLPKVVYKGIIVYDAGQVRPSDVLDGLVGIPMSSLAEQAVKDKNLINTVALGAILGMLEYDFNFVKEVFSKKFAKKGDSVVEMNVNSARAGYDYIKEHYSHAKGIALAVDTKFQKKQEVIKKSKTPRHDGRMLVNGLEAGGFGMVSAGVTFYSAYPMTPSTGLMLYMAAHAQKFTLVVEQAEDEIAAIQLALGASYAGARAATGTSGGGFSLMVESLSLSGITETPIVIYVMQRPGPATGLPTRTEQADLEFAIHAGHGEFPRFVFAPGDPSEMFRISIDAFNLADKYQVPVIILGDQYLADSYRVVDMFDVSYVTRDRSVLSSQENTPDYFRYKLTPQGISPRALPGCGNGLVVVDSDEHDEAGHLTEDLQIRVQQVDKRMKKMESMRREMPGPSCFGDADAPVRLVCWGSTLGVGQEVIKRLRSKGERVGLIHFSSLWPFPRESAREALRGAQRLIGVENNSQGQLCHLIRAELGIEIKEKILKYNGMQFFPEEVIDGYAR